MKLYVYFLNRNVNSTAVCLHLLFLIKYLSKHAVDTNLRIWIAQRISNSFHTVHTSSSVHTTTCLLESHQTGVGFQSFSNPARSFSSDFVGAKTGDRNTPHPQSKKQIGDSTVTIYDTVT